MPLTELWLTSRSQVEDKQVHQIIAFAGDGVLKDGSTTAQEFRDLLSHLPTTHLTKYAEECLVDSFRDSGFVLQDVVNEMGRRLGFQVVNGRYRGTTTDIGHDGLWQLPQGHSIIVEVKTSDNFRIDLNAIARYRRKLADSGQVDEERSSILIIMGREDTGDLEAQIRGSRHAWDIRLISVDALIRLLALKEEVEDRNIIRQIHEILIPREFTKLDEIIDIIFSTAEEVKYVEADQSQLLEGEFALESPSRASFADACIPKIENYLRQPLVKRSRVLYSTPDNSLLLVCLVSKVHTKGGHSRYWFAFRPTHQEFLTQSENSFIALGCGSDDSILLIPFSDFRKWLNDMHSTGVEGRIYWHVDINVTENELVLQRKKGTKPINLMIYFLPG